MDEERKIVAGCLKGERWAQHELYLRFKDRLFALCMRYTDSNEEAEDVLQDGFIKIYRDLGNYKPIAPLYTWTRQVVIRTALENIRRKKSRIGRGIPVEEAYSLGEKEKSSGELGAQELMKLIQSLPLDLRTVFNLYAIDGYSHREISQMLTVTEASSKMRLSRARAILKKEVEQLFELN